MCDTAREERLSVYTEILCLNKLLYHKPLLVLLYVSFDTRGEHIMCVCVV